MGTVQSFDALAFGDWTQQHQQRIEQTLAQAIPSEETLPPRLNSAMRYAVLGGGKRVRALLCYASAHLVQASDAHADAAAAAVELVHAFSLVHDDMPCMDDDDLRRGKPSCHKQFDDATALLVGDALQSLAFEHLTLSALSPTQQIKQVSLLAFATGSRGMCGGQSIDLSSTGKALPLNELETMHQYKTGALIRASILLGAYCAPQLSEQTLVDLESISRDLGLAFQVVDDILDSTADTATLGKTAGKDAAQQKSTYVSLLGLDAARELAQSLHARTLQTLSTYGDNAQALRGLADFIIQRPF